MAKENIYRTLLETAISSGEKCTVCGERIPADVVRISFGYTTRYGMSFKRICGYCIIRLAKEVDEKPIEKWLEKKMVKSL